MHAYSVYKTLENNPQITEKWEWKESGIGELHDYE